MDTTAARPHGSHARFGSKPVRYHDAAEDIGSGGSGMTTPRQLQEMYAQGQNITAFLRDEQGLEADTRDIIEIAYDLQAGSYIASMDNDERVLHKNAYAQAIADTILTLGEPVTVLEAGVGEATTLSGVLQRLNSDVRGFGFDLSWSRAAHGMRWLQSQGITNASLSTGDLVNIPFGDNAIDVVYTSHSIEPNGGNEEPILRELYRVARNYLVLLEPGYELADAAARERMDAHGYAKNLKATAETLGYDIIEHKLFEPTLNPLNPTALTIIRTNASGAQPLDVFACPQFKTPLKSVGGMLFSPEALAVYPIIGTIPCLRIENAILASKYELLASQGADER
jgi:SAM-dependent methyltransferase